MQKFIKYCVLIIGISLSSTYTRGLLHNEEQLFDPIPFMQPVTLTQEGIGHFFRCYNHPLFTSRILPVCFLNVTDLLSYTKDQSDPYGYACTVIGLFHQRFKDCKWSNPYALAQLLEQLPTLIGPLFKEDEKELLFTYFKEQLYSPNGIHVDEQDCVHFIEQLSNNTHEYLLQTVLAASYLQQVTIRFIESIMDKLVWDPRDDIQTWESFKTIGHHLEHLSSEHIISDHDTLNHLFWSLVYRFCYFLELAGSALSFECYSTMQKDLNQHTISFIQQPEKEQMIRTKISTLAHALRLGSAQSLAYARNILTHPSASS